MQSKTRDAFTLTQAASPLTVCLKCASDAIQETLSLDSQGFTTRRKADWLCPVCGE